MSGNSDGVPLGVVGCEYECSAIAFIHTGLEPARLLLLAPMQLQPPHVELAKAAGDSAPCGVSAFSAWLLSSTVCTSCHTASRRAVPRSAGPACEPTAADGTEGDGREYYGTEGGGS